MVAVGTMVGTTIPAIMDLVPVGAAATMDTHTSTGKVGPVTVPPTAMSFTAAESEEEGAAVHHPCPPSNENSQNMALTPPQAVIPPSMNVSPTT